MSGDGDATVILRFWDQDFVEGFCNLLHTVLYWKFVMLLFSFLCSCAPCVGDLVFAHEIQHGVLQLLLASVAHDKGLYERLRRRLTQFLH